MGEGLIGGCASIFYRFLDLIAAVSPGFSSAIRSQV